LEWRAYGKCADRGKRSGGNGLAAAPGGGFAADRRGGGFADAADSASGYGCGTNERGIEGTPIESVCT
jgi:hypothetical protein